MVEVEVHIHLVYATPINLHEPLPVPQDFHKDLRILLLRYGWLHCPYVYRNLCVLKYVIPFLFVGCLYRPVPNWSTKLTVFLKYYTISPLLQLLLPQCL